MKDNTDKAIFGARMKEAFSDWKEKRKSEGKPASTTAFGQLLDPPASRGSIENYLKGKQKPEPDRIEQIRKILGLPKDYFDTDKATHDELYKHSSLYQTKIGKRHVEFSKLMGLDLNMVRVLSQYIDFDTLFPLYSPIDHAVNDPDTGEIMYDRKVDFSDSAHVEEVDDDLRFLQIERDGKRITLHRCDLAFLKEVQDQVREYVEFLFFKRQKEMDEETEKFNRDRIQVTVNGEPVDDPIQYLKNNPRKKTENYKLKKSSLPLKEQIEVFKKEWKRISESDGDEVHISVMDTIPDQYYRDHDRFAEYCFLFKDQPKPEWCSIYEEEPRPEETPREATQEDIDKFFSPRKGEREVDLVGGGKGIVKEGK